MGLLEKVYALQNKEISEGTGLLAHALALSKKKSASPVDFYNLSLRCGFEKACIFSLTEDCYYISISRGLNASVIVSSLSTKDFWEGTLKNETQWQHISKEEEDFRSFYQIFTEDFLSQISDLYFLPFETNGEKYIFTGFSTNLTEAKTELISPDVYLLELYDFVQTYHKVITDSRINEEETAEGFDVSNGRFYILSIEDRCNKITERIVNEDLRLLVSEAITDSFFYSIKNYFTCPNTIKRGSGNEIKIVLFGEDEIDEKLLEHVLLKGSLGLFEKEDDKPLLMHAGEGSNLQSVKAFILQR